MKQLENTLIKDCLIGHCLMINDNVLEIVGNDKDEHGYFLILSNNSKIYEDSFKSYGMYIQTSYADFTSDVEKYKNNNFDLSKYTQDKKESTELMSYNVATYTNYRELLINQSKYLEAIVTKAQNDLTILRRELMVIVDEMREKVLRLNQIIFIIEIYLGINESVVHLQSGKKADDKEALVLLQEKLYMDEEIGDPTDGGLSIDNEEMLDDWILNKNTYLKCNNYELLLPYNKCIRLIQLRRNPKERQIDNPFVKSMWAEADLVTYLLIRNGDNIYKISSKLEFPSKLFPNVEEFINMQKNYEENKHKYSNSYPKEMQSTIDMYTRNMIVLQGLIDRTEIFNIKLNLLKESDETKVKFMYKQTLVGDDKISPLEWYHNACKVEEGDRVFYQGTLWINREYYKHYFINIYRHNDYAWPPLPSSGVYTLYKQNNDLYIKTPFADRWCKETHKFRRSKMTTAFSVEGGNRILVNINAVSHRDLIDLDRLLHDRRDRKGYLSIVSSLLAIKNQKLKELELEEPFSFLLENITGLDRLECLDHIHWWKTKNKWKRPLEADDMKALRMIIKKIEKEND